MDGQELLRTSSNTEQTTSVVQSKPEQKIHIADEFITALLFQLATNITERL